MPKKTYYVIRDHFGDKEYKVGDERVADETAVKHLIGKCLSTEKPEAKEDPDGDQSEVGSQGDDEQNNDEKSSSENQGENEDADGDASKGDAEKKVSKSAIANKNKAETAIENKGE